MAEYHFLSAWLLRAPAGAVWDALHDAGEWPRWWPGVTATRETAPGGPGGIGRRFEITWRSFLPYALTFEMTVAALDRPRLLEGRAVGELDGTGRWTLHERDGITAVLYQWDVATTKRWMNLVAPAARPVFAFNHDYVMRRGAEGLARRLGAELVART
jgi:uncharacterized protein YndB with AHSA1/START domain